MNDDQFLASGGRPTDSGFAQPEVLANLCCSQAQISNRPVGQNTLRLSPDFVLGQCLSPQSSGIFFSCRIFAFTKELQHRISILHRHTCQATLNLLQSRPESDLNGYSAPVPEGMCFPETKSICSDFEINGRNGDAAG